LFDLGPEKLWRDEFRRPLTGKRGSAFRPLADGQDSEKPTFNDEINLSGNLAGESGFNQ
jgi:hypothetical protein